MQLAPLYGAVDVGDGYKIVPIPPSQETVNTLFNAGRGLDTTFHFTLLCSQNTRFA
jgi:hypothetical protein